MSRWCKFIQKIIDNAELLRISRASVNRDCTVNVRLKKGRLLPCALYQEALEEAQQKA